MTPVTPVTPVTPMTAEDILTAAQALTDDVFGLLRPPHPGGLTQVPLALATCGTPRPGRDALLPGAPVAPVPAVEACGVGETGAWARVDALTAALRAIADRSAVVSEAATDPEADCPHWTTAVGHDAHSLACDALARCLIGQVLTGGDSTAQALNVRAGDDAHAWRWLKTLTLRWGATVTVRHHVPAALPTWHVVDVVVGRDRYFAAGPSRLGALRHGLQRACGAVQAARDPAGPPPPDPMGVAAADPAELRAALEALEALGHRLLLRPWTAWAAAAESGIQVARAGLSHV
jgi:hypothetical protein